MVAIPFWLTQRGGKVESIDDHTIRVTGTDLPTCELSVFPMPTGVGWRVAVELVTATSRQTLAQTESPFENEQSAWQAGFDLYRQRVEPK